MTDGIGHTSDEPSDDDPILGLEKTAHGALRKAIEFADQETSIVLSVQAAMELVMEYERRKG